MALVVHRDVQHSEPWNVRVFLRELNERLRNLSNTLNANRRETLNQRVYITAANATQVVWIPSEDYVVTGVNVYGTTAAGTVTPRINTVNMGGVGGGLAVTMTPTLHPLTSPNEVTALDLVDVVTAGLTGTMTVDFILRRVN